MTHELNDDQRSLPVMRRFASLDIFRGAIIAAMVVVNNPGDPSHVYSQLAHAAWHGMTVTDVIAPWFLWVIGVTTSISASRRMEGTSSAVVFGHAVRRGAILYVIGLVLVALPVLVSSASVSWHESIKLMGVLQRIAICYVLGSLLFLLLGAKGRLSLAIVLLVGYWIIMVWIPGPGEGGGPFDVVGNRAYLFDRQVLGDFGEGTSHSLLTIPAVTSTVLFGTLAGDVIRGNGTVARKILWLAGGGVVLCVVGLLVSEWIPINRRIWTPSFVLLTAGLAAVVLAALIWLVDVRRLRQGTGWMVAYGANPIFLFVLSEAGRVAAGMKGITDSGGQWRSYWTIGYEALLAIADPKAASAIVAVAYAGAIGIVAVLMYRKGWIIKV